MPQRAEIAICEVNADVFRKKKDRALRYSQSGLIRARRIRLSVVTAFPLAINDPSRA
jgi:hypothetical protein